MKFFKRDILRIVPIWQGWGRLPLFHLRLESPGFNGGTIEPVTIAQLPGLFWFMVQGTWFVKVRLG